MYAMTLRARPRAKRELWISKGVRRLARRGTLFNYWKKRLAEHPEDLSIFEAEKACFYRRGGKLPPALTDEEIQLKIQNAAARSVPTKPVAWPTFLKPLLALAKPEDKGVGDIIARTIGPIGGDAFKVWYKRLFGKSCGCQARQDRWNAQFPLN